MQPDLTYKYRCAHARFFYIQHRTFILKECTDAWHTVRFINIDINQKNIIFFAPDKTLEDVLLFLQTAANVT